MMARAPLALLAAGAVLVLGALVFAPPPMTFDGGAVGGADEAPRALAARGPALVRHEPESDTTVAIFLCGHWYCETAVRLTGDARGALDGGRLYLVATDRAPGVAPLDPAFDVPDGPAQVVQVAQARFTTRPFWPAFVALPLSALCLAAGALAHWQGAPRATRAGAGALVGGALATFFATFGGDAIVWGFLYVVAACALALVVMSVGAWKKARWAAGGFVVATLLLFVYARPWFPSAPSL